MRRRVLIGMSGGADSSAACSLLKEQGYDVVGLTIRNFDIDAQFISMNNSVVFDEPNHVREARKVAKSIGIEHFVADEREMFGSKVVDPFIQGYLSGKTPNPCVTCNPLFKFKVLERWAASLNCEFIATGHYARIVDQDGWRFIKAGADKRKDQSYFLWNLDQGVLAKTLFPLGDMHKKEVYEYLGNNGLDFFQHSAESMEICFVENDYRELIRERVKDVDKLIGPDKYVDITGKIIGEHRGYPYYTIGQRKGLGVALGKPVFVLKINSEKNTVMLGDQDQLLSTDLLVENARFRYQGEKLIKWLDQMNIKVKIRYRSLGIECRIVSEFADGRILISFCAPAFAVTPGQSAVFYSDDLVVGGAEISSQKNLYKYMNAQ